MIKRIIGILATLVVLALVVFTAIGSGSYRSVLSDVKGDEPTAVVDNEEQAAASAQNE